VARGGGMPLIDLSLLADAAFIRGLAAVFCFFFANLSFYLVMTIYMQRGLHMAPMQAGLVFVPLALTFVLASRHSSMRARHRGTLVLIEGCAVQIVGLAALAATAWSIETPSALTLSLVLTIFGYGQGLVMAPLSNAVLSTVKPASAGAGSGMYGTTAQIANAAGVAAIGAAFFAIESSGSARLALLATTALFAWSIIACAAFLTWMRRGHGGQINVEWQGFRAMPRWLPRHILLFWWPIARMHRYFNAAAGGPIMRGQAVRRAEFVICANVT